jgi:hypothetical protein
MPKCTDAIWIEGKNIDNKIHPALPSRCSKDKKNLGTVLNTMRMYIAYSCSLTKYVSLVSTTVREAADDDILTHLQLNTYCILFQGPVSQRNDGDYLTTVAASGFTCLGGTRKDCRAVGPGPFFQKRPPNQT